MHLIQPFSFDVDMFFGIILLMVADGIAFLLQPWNTSVGSSGGGLVIKDFASDFCIEFDNHGFFSNNSDPYYDHIAYG